MGPCELVTAAREKKFSSSKKLSCGSQLGATECIPVGGIPRRQGIRCCLQGHLQSQDIYVGIHGHQAVYSMSGKRKRCVISLEEKFKALTRLDNGETIKMVTADLEVGEVTVGDWRQNR
ncbi:hypothetical protein J6590_100770 [Homalodisca vitripennis]|nr:hypothetical protein J6590_100770 [Homalodisca vitripennis]